MRVHLENYRVNLTAIQAKVRAESRKVDTRLKKREQEFLMSQDFTAASYDDIKADQRASALLKKEQYAKALLKRMAEELSKMKS